MRPRTLIAVGVIALAGTGCGGARTSYVRFPDTVLGRVVIYRNGVAYFERSATVNDDTLRLSVPAERVDDFLRSLTVVDADTGQPAPVSYPTAGAPPGWQRPHRHEDRPFGRGAAPTQALLRHRVAVLETELSAGDGQAGQGRGPGVGGGRQHLGRGLEPDQAGRRLELGDVLPLRPAHRPHGPARDAPLERPVRAGAAGGRGDLRPGRRSDAGAGRAERFQPRPRDGGQATTARATRARRRPRARRAAVPERAGVQAGPDAERARGGLRGWGRLGSGKGSTGGVRRSEMPAMSPPPPPAPARGQLPDRRDGAPAARDARPDHRRGLRRPRRQRQERRLAGAGQPGARAADPRRPRRPSAWWRSGGAISRGTRAG